MDQLQPILQSKFVVQFSDVSLVVALDFSPLFSDEANNKVVSSEDLIPTFTSILSTLFGTVSALVTFNHPSSDPPVSNELAADQSQNLPSLTPSPQQISSKSSLTDFETNNNPINFASVIEDESLQNRQHDIPSPQDDFSSLACHYLTSCPLTLSEEGVGGTYFLEDLNGDNFAVFKPVDEEPGSPNNPKKLVTNPLLPPGGGGIREAAAFLLDRGFAGVPPTHYLENVPTSNGIKSGSIQKFMKNDGESSSVGSSSFLVDDVHRIGILDIRIFNMDRNGENILIKKEGNQHKLIPIDHSYCLPETLDGAYFDWMFWRQAKQSFSPETMRYIEEIDVEEDKKILRSLGFSEGSIRTMVVATLLLKHCVLKLGKNLFEVASMVCRDHTGSPSKLEELVSLAEEADNFYASFESLLLSLV